MGYRAQVITQHREYGATIFHSWSNFQSYLNYLRAEYEDIEDAIYENEDESYYEIKKEVIQKEIERLEKTEPNFIVFQLEEESKYVLASLRAALDESVKEDDYIALEWY